ncbi:MFS transporter [Pseudomonas sp. KSR10]|uniref:MFS transporter n=1 Tax=Pseudomonas sp. KSR10 TaxID=2916654 RepID=UPI001EF8BC0D|nr:MFS transporter [Pseudomonas sp. KSR10]MCG6538690.1 MFS transporter [Pseudomonas sp. KSR10]
MLMLARSFGALYLATVLMQFGATLMMTYLALSMAGNGGEGLGGGALMAANSLGMVLGASIGSRFIQTVGHIRTYAACAGIIAAVVLSHAFFDNLGIWLLLRCVMGAATMCQLMVLESWLNEQTHSEHRGRALALYMVASYVGMALGQLALTVNGDLGSQVLIVVAIAFSLCLVPVALTRSLHPAAVEPIPISITLFLRRLPLSLATILVSGMINGSFFGLSAIYARKLGLSTAEVGQFMALAIGAGLLAQWPLGWISDRLPRASLIRVVALLLSIACLPLAGIVQLTLPWLLVFSASVGFFQFCLYPLGAALANDNIESELRVPLAGMVLLTFGAGACLGPLIAGGVMHLYGSSWLYAYLAVCAALLAVAVSQRKVKGDHLREDAPLHQPVMPNALASSAIIASVEQSAVAEEGTSSQSHEEASVERPA